MLQRVKYTKSNINGKVNGNVIWIYDNMQRDSTDVLKKVCNENMGF